MRGWRARVAVAVVVAFGSGGCQLVLGIDPDVAVSSDASTSGDSEADGTSARDTGGDGAVDAGQNFNVYIHEKFLWIDDDASGAVVVYADDAGGPLGQLDDIKVTLTRVHGGWGALAPAPPFDTSPYVSLHFTLKPTAANQTWTCYLFGADGGAVLTDDVSTHGGPLDAGVWGFYSIPLTDLAGTTKISSLLIQDTTDAAASVWYVDDVGFIVP